MYLLPHGVVLAIRLVNHEINKLRKKRLLIALDGHSSSGKSTLAKDLSTVLEITHVDSGAMYRAVTLYLHEHNINLDDDLACQKVLNEIEISFEIIDGVSITFMNEIAVEDKIRSMKVSELVSKVSTISCVRKFLVDEQRKLAESGGVIMDGRDIGTVVFPHADVKLYVTASLDIRTERRYTELIEKGMNISKSEVRDNLLMRDNIDSNRTDSPLRKADDAYHLDTSDLDRGEMLAKSIQIIYNHINR